MKRSLCSFFLALVLLAPFGAEEAKAQRKGGKAKGTAGETNEQEKVKDLTSPGKPREAVVKGEAREALSAAESKASEAEKNKDWEEAAKSYIQASNTARKTGQLQKAISYGNKAFEMAEKAGSPLFQARATFQLANAFKQVGQHAKVRESLQKGIEVVKQAPAGPAKQALEANLYRELGTDFLQSGDNQKAIEYISYALQVQEARLTFFKTMARRKNPQAIQNSQNFVAVTLDRLANAYRRAGKVEEAIKAYERALGIVKESGLSAPVEGNIYQGLGKLYLDQKDYPRALANLQRALEMAERQQLAVVIQRASSQIGDVFLQTQRPAEAIPYYKKAIDTIESTRSLLESEELRTTFFEDKGQIYGGIILAHLGAKNVEEAFNYAERARSRAFLDILGSKVQLTRSGALLEEERALQARISALKAKTEEPGEEDEEGAADRGQLRREVEAAQKAYTDFLAKVRKEDKEQASLMTVEPLALRELQELLEPGVSVLEYFVLRGRAVLWVVEKDRVNFVRLSLNRAELISKVSALRENIYQVGEKEKFKAISQELYKVLIEPALPHIRGKELLIIPHDVLHYLPFQALVSSQGKYLIQDYPIYYLSSASLMQFTREKKRASRDRALIMGNPSLGDPAYDLRFAEREAREVARLYPQSAVYLKTEATKSRAISSSPNYDILHFAVHGELSEDDPLSSGLLLASETKQDGKLTVADIFSLNLKADAIVLSACETGLGKITSGDEIIGLSRAFIYAGTPSVITTLWKVNDRASYELMREFYTNLKTKKKAESLRQAQLKIIEAYPEPFFWAAYGLTGEP